MNLGTYAKTDYRHIVARFKATRADLIVPFISFSNLLNPTSMKSRIPSLANVPVLTVFQ